MDQRPRGGAQQRQAVNAQQSLDRGVEAPVSARGQRPRDIGPRAGLDIDRQALAAQVRHGPGGAEIEVQPAWRLHVNRGRAEARLHLRDQLGVVGVAIDHRQPVQPHPVDLHPGTVHRRQDAAQGQAGVGPVAQQRGLAIGPAAQRQQRIARRPQPHHIQSFFVEAFKHLGCQIKRREDGRWEITHVPPNIRERDRQVGTGAPIQKKYERICFEKNRINQQPVAAFRSRCARSTAGRPSLSPSSRCPLTSPPEKPSLHMHGARRQGISTAFATRPLIACTLSSRQRPKLQHVFTISNPIARLWETKRSATERAR